MSTQFGSPKKDPVTPTRADVLKPVSIQDVAARAGVSTATVSRVLNTPNLVAATTSQKVREAIDALGYRPNLFAKGLMTRRSHLIGLVVPPLAEGAWCHVIKHATVSAQDCGYRIVVYLYDHVSSSPVTSDFLDGMVIWHDHPPAVTVPVELVGTLTNVAEATEKTRAAVLRLVERLRVPA
jgi:hypothetical protein